MAVFLEVHDEQGAGQRTASWRLELPEPTITVRELIRTRVYEEVRRRNRDRTDGTEIESADWHEQAEKALDAFTRRSFLLLVDDRQVQSLDEQIRVDESTEVVFLRLVPLVGG